MFQDAEIWRFYLFLLKELTAFVLSLILDAALYLAAQIGFWLVLFLCLLGAGLRSLKQRRLRQRLEMKKAPDDA
ncbi:hypothetical protein GTO89_15625 [Heliobacterium gestii]|uniref:Uncharacterized protein n=1 Tax=Heliomicrobium gestii TaxID=2699 RepID=A0A845LCS0_HELGE|nr:hypothetical protein [Heliomicrobium gestii]MBM7868269.1 nucleoside recognition membrane protein YjiH [Heliomicrobium gestii]MZP44462.1 hypothetical protein [Heliomicrobium gestii]